jgi:hypothetical protein
MAKKVKIIECCVLTKDDKGALSLVGKAKEAITSLIKNKIDVTIALCETSKEDAEKFLKESNIEGVNFLELPKEDEQYDAVVVGGSNVITLHSDWKWTLEDLVRHLYDGRDDKPKSEQQQMDAMVKDIKKLTQERARKMKSGELSEVIY